MQKIISFILYNIAKFIGYLDDLVTKHAYIPRDSTLEGFQGLTPRDNLDNAENADNFEHYEKEIKKALDSKYIKNIAISGAYGAGKSSILRTFERKHPRYKYINISLASFNVKGSLTPEEKKELEAKIEKSIMQQIFYKVESSELPFSKFARIKNTHKSTAFVKALLFFFWLVAGYFIYKGFDFPNTSFAATIFDGKNYPKSIVMIFFAMLSVTILYVFNRAASNSILNKLTFKGTEIVVPGSSKLNDFLDEFLYFFEVTPYQVVVFEDLDRHDNDSIFTKLRELNELINNADQIKRYIPIKFVYAIKDEMFTGTERTKFFDYIIPVIPVITPANTGEVLWLALAAGEATEEATSISKSFIYSIAIYIEDMRMLKNISYEFLVYRSCIKVKDNKEELEKLFSLIVYKNCFPEDFAKLHRNEGLLAGLFANKQKLISTKKESILEVIEEKKGFIDKLTSEHLKSIEELKYLYVGALLKHCPAFDSININGSSIRMAQLLSEDNFKFFSEMGTNILTIYNVNGYSVSPKITFSQLEDDIGSYSERLELLNQKEKGNESVLQKEIEELQNEIAELNVKKLSSLIDDNYISLDELTSLNNQDKDSVEFKSLKYHEKDLIVFLLRNAYIDENYQTYISYFYEGSLTQLEHDFIKNVQNQRKSDETLDLKNCQEVFERLSILDIKSHFAFNINLLSYALCLDDSDKKDVYLTSVCDGKPASISFIAKFIVSKNENLGKLLNILFKLQPNIWVTLVKELGGSREQKESLFEQVLESVDEGDIITAVKAANDEGLATFISESFYFIQNLGEEKRKAAKKVVNHSDVKFLVLTEFDKNSDFAQFVYEENKYILSYSNISTLVEAYSPDTSQDELCSLPLTTVLKTDCESLKDYINNNLKDYVDNTLLLQTSTPMESEETVLKLINSEQLTNELKNKVLEKVKVSISDTSKVVDKEYCESLIANNFIEATWDNIYHCFITLDNEAGLAESIVDFLNAEDNCKQLGLKKVAKSDFDDEKQALSLFESIYKCNDLNDESYKALLEATHVRWSNLSFAGLSEEKVRLLISTGSLGFNLENLRYIENHYEDLCLTFIGKNIEEYLSDPDLYDLDSKELVVLYNMDDIKDSTKVKLTSLVDEADLVAEEDLIKQVVSCLLRTSDVLNVNLEILTSLIVLHQNLNEKKILLAKVMPLMKKVDVKECLVNLDKKYEDIFNRRKPKFDVNDENTELLKALESKGLISQFVLVGKKYRIEPKRDPLS